MFTYFHCYLPETWDAQVKAGLITKKTGGVRCVMTIRLDEKYKFNELAAKGGDLYKTVVDNGYPLYIDRLQGGDYINPYEYDKELVEEYKRLLGDKFFGFQMHEWLSNYKNDLNGLARIPDDKWTAEEIKKDVFRRNPFPFLNLSAMTAEEMEKFRPKTLEEFLKAGEWLLHDRQKKTDGELTSCDSYYLTFPQEIKSGVKRIMPEIGHQTPNTRIQLAYARGMAKAYGIKYGAYYESWGGHPFSVCCYQKDGKNEWAIEKAADFPYEMKGQNGGSSRSLQRRLHLYAYMAGATFMSEEWGMCNTFYDWEKFELSPYGKVKLEFIKFVEKYSEIGIPVAPIAAVVPKDFIVQPAMNKGKYIDFAVSGAFGRVNKKVQDGLKKIFCSSSPAFGLEARSLKNCKTYDCVDIITEEEADKGRYDFFIDLTSSEAFAEKYKEKIIPATVKEVNKRAESYLPCTVKGGVLKQFTRTENGEYYILLTNNGGITNTVKKGETVSPFSTRIATIRLKEGKALVVEETDASVKNAGEKIKVTIPAGGYFFARITDK